MGERAGNELLGDLWAAFAVTLSMILQAARHLTASRPRGPALRANTRVMLQCSALQISPLAFMLIVSNAPTTRWSCTLISSGASARSISRVRSMSAREGVGSPLG